MVETKGLTKDDVDSLTLKVQAIMQENFEKLNDEVAATISMKFWIRKALRDNSDTKSAGNLVYLLHSLDTRRRWNLIYKFQ